MRLHYEAIEKKNLETKETSLLISRVSKGWLDHYKSMSRLLDILKAKDNNIYHLNDYGVRLSRLHKNDAFNTSPVVLFEKIGFPKRGKEFRLRAIQRLSKYLTSKNNEGYYYCGSYSFKRVGTVIYNQFSTTIEYLTDEEKSIRLKNKVRGQKATLTKAINEAHRIRESFSTTLFPQEYQTHEKFLKLIEKIKSKRVKLAQVKRLTINDIPSISSNLPDEELKRIESFVSMNFKLAA